MEKIKKFVEKLGIPSWGYINNVEVEGRTLVITYCDRYRIILDEDSEYNDCISAEGDIAWGRRDIEFAMEVLDSRDEILEMV